MNARLAWAIWWVLLAALYLLLVDTINGPELAAGAVAAAVAATGAALVRRQRRLITRPRAAWLGAAARAMPGMFTDLVPLARVLLERGVLRRPGSGSFIEVPYGAPRERREAAAHRAFTEAIGSLTPNTIVFEVDEAEGVARAHQLHPEGDPERRVTPLGP